MVKTMYVIFLISASLYAVWGGGVSVIIPSQGPEESVAAIRKQDNAPKVEIAIPGAPEYLTWNTQVRYTISVSDPKDGESRYGEINPRTCVMEIEYFPAGDETNVDELIERSSQREEHKGLSLMRRATCFGCHADKSRLAGPSFAEIAARYENSPVTAQELGSHVIAGSSGIWGDLVMPAHPDLTLEEATQIADFILEEGANKNRWIYPGLEGGFRVIEKPEDHDQGVYVLTASYISMSNIRGVHAVAIKVK